MKCLNVFAILLIAISSSLMSACTPDKEDEPQVTEQNWDDDDDDDDEPTGRWRKCEWCDGSGICYLCHGTGWLGSNNDKPCPSCDSEDGVCENCHGRGKVFY